MSGYATCDICDRPLEMCDCHECWCGKKIEAKFKWCGEDCKQEAINDHIQGKYA